MNSGMFMFVVYFDSDLNVSACEDCVKSLHSHLHRCFHLFPDRMFHHQDCVGVFKLLLIDISLTRDTLATRHNDAWSRQSKCRCRCGEGNERMQRRCRRTAGEKWKSLEPEAEKCAKLPDTFAALAASTCCTFTPPPLICSRCEKCSQSWVVEEKVTDKIFLQRNSRTETQGVNV